MQGPLVSVLMTAYNREKYIGEAIESVLASTYTHFELIIVDDQSSDRTVEIAREYEKKDSRIKLYINEQNLGDYPNRNRAASYAKGKYLKYVDADDYVYPYGLEQLVFYMEQFPKAGYGLCSLAQEESRIYPFQLVPKESYERHYFSSPFFHKSPLSSIINREKFCEIGGFSGKRMVGDFELWHILSRVYPVVLMPGGIVWHRTHDGQESHDIRTDPLVQFQYLLLTEELLAQTQCPLSEEKLQLALSNNKKQIARKILSAIKHHSVKKGIQLFRHSNFSFLEFFQYSFYAFFT